MTKFTEVDQNYMAAALEEGRKGFAEDEVPVGAVLVYKERVIARAHNQMESTQDATRHAEMLCLQAGAKFLNNWRLIETTLYVTVEPCLMCLGASILSRVKKIVWGCSDKRHGACGGWINATASDHPIHKIESLSGVLEKESAALMKKFFQQRRREKLLSNKETLPLPLSKTMEETMQDLITYQKKRLLALAKEIVPQVTEDDLAQPFDFPELETHPDFRHEEGVLEGMMSVHLAIFSAMHREENLYTPHD